MSFGAGGVRAWAVQSGSCSIGSSARALQRSNNRGVKEKIAGRRHRLTAQRLTPSLHFQSPAKFCRRGKRKLHLCLFPSCIWPEAHYAVTDMGRSAEGLAGAILTSWHPAMNPVICSGDDHTVQGNTSRVFLSALIRCSSVPLILWVSSRFHYLCLCLADGGCISVQLNPGCAEHDDIPATEVLKLFLSKADRKVFLILRNSLGR